MAEGGETPLAQGLGGGVDGQVRGDLESGAEGNKVNPEPQPGAWGGRP
jgi:hypothetical protein